MPVDEGKLNEAFAAVDEAENYAVQADFAKSVFKFQQALDLFQKCGLPPQKKRTIMDKISDRQAEIARIQQYVREHPDALQEVLASIGGNAPASPPSQPIETPPIIAMPAMGMPSAEPVPNTQMAETQGIAALDEANALVQQGRLMEAVTKFYEAAEKLIMAGWNESNLMNIQAEVQRISEVVQNQQNQAPFPANNTPDITPTFAQVQQGTSQPNRPRAGGNPQATQVFTPTFAQVAQGAPAPQQQQSQRSSQPQVYTPTFAQMDQGTSVPVKPRAIQPVANQVFTPTFAQVAQGAPAPQPQQSQRSSQPQAYTPTFAQTDQGTSVPVKPRAAQPVANQVFTPTFAQVAQGVPTPQPQQAQRPSQPQAYSPTFAQMNQGTPAPAVTPKVSQPKSQEYVPTFTQTQQSVNIPVKQAPNGWELESKEPQGPTFTSVSTKAEGVFDPEEFKRMMNATKTPVHAQNAPTFVETGQQDVTPMKAKTLEPSAGGPTFLSLENATFLSQKANELQKACQQQQEMLISMQKEAFDNINTAVVMQKEKKIQLAIEKLEEALDMFNSLPGWSGQTTPLYNRLHILQTYLAALGQDANASKLSMDQMQEEFTKLLVKSGAEFSDETIDKNALKWDIQAENLFKDWISKLNQAQIDAFELLEMAQTSIVQAKWESAIASYNKCLIILTEIGWVAQTTQIQVLLNELITVQKQSDSSLSGVEAVNAEGLSNEAYKAALQTQYENRRNRIQSLEQQKVQQEQAQKNALKIVEGAEKMVGNSQYDTALEKYREAANLLLTSGWQEHIGPINERMNQIRQDRDTIAQKKQEAHKRMLEKQRQEIEYQAQVQKLIVEKQRQMTQQQQSSKAITEQQNQMRAIQNQITQIIGQADQLANKNDIKSAIAKYNEAKALMQKSGWTDQMAFMAYLINNLEDKRKAKEETQALIKARSDQTKKAQVQFQAYLKQQADILAHEQEAKRQQLEEFVKQRDQTTKLQDDAFKFMDSAEKALKYNQFDEAVGFYTKAGELFKQIGWNIQNIQIQINQVYQMKMQYQQSLSEAAMSQQQAQAAQKAAVKLEDMKKKEEIASLLDIKSMIKMAAVKKEQKIATPSMDARLYDRAQMKAELDAWKSKKKTSSSSLRAELMGSNITEQDQVMAEEMKKEEKISSDMDEVRAMLKKMSAKKTSDKK